MKNNLAVFEEAKKYIPAKRCGTPEEVSVVNNPQYKFFKSVSLSDELVGM